MDRAEQPNTVEDPAKLVAPASAPFELTDLTDPEVRQELMQARMLRQWVLQQRAEGALPN